MKRVKRVYEPDPIVEMITAMRIKRGYTQMALAEALGISQSMISDLETGKVQPTIKTLRKYLDFFDKDLYVYARDKKDRK